ncbi:hypothetical protein Poli38472_007064 [Pythium oligandrum]|uniref:Uncharacterized protein n=1 Tax=Pythium oligandrum TaxID=41045 RepID=A0A8K1FFE9_PYTOL|nr:hypothetical protein Poli38472_007064 [Pythium oligandrum]|eukprot:TMW58919.1 hypothetical protein Poli38472_007064 [Pythium oligandrum]
MGLAITMILLSAGCTLIQPLLIKAIIQYLQDTPNLFGTHSGYILVLWLSLAAFVGSTAVNFSGFLLARAGCNARLLIVNAVYQKLLRLSATARRTMNSGEILTLVSVDSERLVEAYVLGVWSVLSPIILFVLCVLVGWQMNAYVGLLAFLAVSIILLLALTTSRAVGRLRRRIAKLSAERVKLTNEALQGIRAIKLYGWEDAMQRTIQSLREQEVDLLRRYNHLRLYNAVLLLLAPTTLTAVCFSTHVLLGHELNVATAFTVLALTNACRLPFAIFANATVYVSEAGAAASRIGEFLLADEVVIEKHQDTSLKNENTGISLKNATFCWVEDALRPILDDITLSLAPGTLTVVVGGVGSGKTSLIQAILGEMIQTKGERNVNGEIAYASQQPWIQHQSVRENILFGAPYDREHYDNVLTACQLGPDLAILEHGDATEVGERGINLSGGQKARVSLARALYRSRNCDVLLFDDPLSALDVHVANAVFSQGLCGIAKDKTRLLVLNAHYHLLSAADRILVMQDGRIVGDGRLTSILEAFPFLKNEPASEKSEAAGAIEEPRNVKFTKADDQDEKKPSRVVVDEDRNIGSVTAQAYLKYLSYCGWPSVTVALAIVTLFTLAQVVLFLCDWFLSRWSNGSYRQDLNAYQSMGIYLGLIAVASVLALARGAFYTNVSMRCSSHLHSRYLRKVLMAPVPSFFDVTPVGRILNRFSRDLDQVDSPLPYYSLMTLTLFFQMSAALIVCGVSMPYVLILYAPLAGAFVVVTKFFQRSARELKRLDSISRSPFVHLVSETIHGIETIRSFQRTPDFAQRCQQLLDANGKCFFTFHTAMRWFAMRTDWLVATILVVVALLVLATKASIGPVVAGLALTYASQLTWAFQRVISVATQTESIMTCFERISYYDSLDEEGGNATYTPLNDWPRTGTITFDHVAMRYRPDLPLVVHDVSFSVQSGEKVGICGRTGSGKTSLVGVLFRTVECSSGVVRIDGVDIATLPLSTLRAKLTIIPQDPMLFSGSLRFNLDPFNENSDAELWEVLRKVHLASVVEQWNEGLEYEVAEKGDNASVGQRQLICIARALLRRSLIVVMDEATANVDQESDKLIQQTVRDSFAGPSTTVLCIAHRLETILHSDKILMLDNGRVKEFGSPQTLLQRSDSAFRALVHSTRVE